ncbi:hypothetical protein BTO06_09980 [Tenacibaculum sp. SZ-18]|uniref:hypothetical protein n=1 Tax=Tenacibaculum sp. SZ-18 TaxID=754423 RepID=UPI000C2D2998|nr:hypothetical protein [Tenacibaculum sp. SZ-18]AUC15449.1 hypothetical protein BTO06_09980 [Tenacibaculum sp. SZ-18]
MYYNEEGKDVTRHIINNRTLLIEGEDLETRDLADLKAKEMKTSSYEVFKKNDNGRLSFIGYGIPK